MNDTAVEERDRRCPCRDVGDQTRSFRTKPIASLDLASFERPVIENQRPIAVRALWYVVNAILFQSSLPALLPSRAKAAVLRLFGAKVGRGLVIKPRVTIKSPWFLEVGDNVWIGERAWIDNHTRVRLGSDVCVSQGVCIFTGNHDWSDPRFGFFCKPVEVGDGSWITAFRVLGPGTLIPPHVVVLS